MELSEDILSQGAQGARTVTSAKADDGATTTMLALIIAVAALMPLPLTLAQLPQPGAVWGDSADFTLDTRPNFRFGRFADSPNFVLDTRGSVLVSGLSGLVLEADRFGRRRGPLAGAAVEVAGAGSGSTDGQGEFAFGGLGPGTYTVTVSKAGYHAVSRSVGLVLGETRREVFVLAAESAAGMPAAFDFASPNGNHFIEGMPGNVSFATQVAWNGSPGQVYFVVAGTKYSASISDLGTRLALATLSVPAPKTIPACEELAVEVINGEGQTCRQTAGVFFHPMPGIVPKWYGNSIHWAPAGRTMSFAEQTLWQLWKAEIPSGVYSSEASVGFSRELRFDPVAGVFTGLLGGVGAFNQQLEFAEVENLGEGRLELAGTLAITLAGYNPPAVTPGWRVSATGKAGIGAPVVLAVDVIFPPASPLVHGLLKEPVVKDIVGAARMRLFLIGGFSLSGEYANGQWGDCFLGATAFKPSGTLGLEGQSVLAGFGAEVGVYAGATSMPEFTICPEWRFEGITLRGYVGVFANALGFQWDQQVGVEICLFGPGGQARLAGLADLALPKIRGTWQPIGASLLRWGEANRVMTARRAGLMSELPGQSETRLEQTILTNVSLLTSPAVLATTSGPLVVFALHDVDKPWHAATDIAVAKPAREEAWTISRVTDDLMAEFAPRIVAVDTNLALAAWARVSGDVSGATNPVQVAPRLEIVAAWLDVAAGNWSEPFQLTTNAVVDRAPLPVVCGNLPAILWVQNAGEESLGNASNGDQLMFSAWSGGGWEAPQVLWAGAKGILAVAFTGDRAGEGHVVMAVDEDGDLGTYPDRELYGLSTVNGAWQAAARLTNDQVEDALPVLLGPNGAPVCVWSAGGALVYTPLRPWAPKPVYGEATLANQAPTLDGVSLPGGAAIAYAVQGTNGVEIVASFYDAQLDRWSLPRPMTRDEHAESALALECDGSDLVIAYLKTQTLRTRLDIEINGQAQHLENVPQPGRTDLCVLRQALGNDLAVAENSFVVDPPNPGPGSVATNRVVVENRGELPAQGVQVVFYDGDPQHGGAPIANAQTITGPLVGGASQTVEVVWAVPPELRTHDLYAVVDPALALEDRDRANNVWARRTVLPDLAIQTCWSTEVSATNVMLVARLTNVGVVPSGPCAVAWRFGAVDGQELGRSAVPELAARAVFDVSCLWDATGRQVGRDFVPVFAVADAAGEVEEMDETNNTYPQSVRVRPAWALRIVQIEAVAGGGVRLVFEATGGTPEDFVVEGSAAVGGGSAWTEEVGARISMTEPGRFQVELPQRESVRFYRVRALR
jgi:hypothetical protein